jgi:hypothetical protein
MGSSKGGGVAINSSWKPMRDAIGTEFQFALHIPLYGIAMNFENFERESPGIRYKNFQTE